MTNPAPLCLWPSVKKKSQTHKWQTLCLSLRGLSLYLGTSLLGLLFQIFKYPLEKEGQVGGPILAQEEIKTIFGSIPDIYEVHTRIKVGMELFDPVIESRGQAIHPEQLLMLMNVFRAGRSRRAGDELVGRQECRWHHSEICECDGVLIYVFCHVCDGSSPVPL